MIRFWFFEDGAELKMPSENFPPLMKTEGKSKEKKIVSSTAKVLDKAMFTLEQNQTVSMELDLLMASK